MNGPQPAVLANPLSAAILKPQNKALTQALLYSKMGWEVQALEGIINGRCSCQNSRTCGTPGAHPIARTPATGYAPTIQSIFARRPHANVGLVLGAASGIFALHVDAQAGGTESLVRLQEDHGGLPNTLTATATGSSEYRLFKLPSGVQLNANLGRSYPGLTLKGEGEFIVVEPSTGPAATSWQDCDDGELIAVADAPDWLIDLATGRPIQQSQQTVATVAPPPVNGADPADAVPSVPAVTNEDFMLAVFGPFAAGESAWACGFPESPADKKARWGGQRVVPGEAIAFFNPATCNTYFSTAVIAGAKRQKAFAKRLAVVVVDDVDLAHLARSSPSYVIETSPGNHQAGYIISSGGDDLVKCDQLMKALYDLKLLGGDKSGNNIVRYVRLPVGVNTKHRESGPFAHRLTTWNPDLKYSLDDAAMALGVDLSALAPPSVPPPASARSASGASLAAREAAWRALISDPDLDARSYHNAITEWAASRLATGMVPGAVVDTLRGEMLAVKPTPEQCAAQGRSYSEEQSRWQERYDNDIRHAVSTAQQKFSQSPGKTLSAWPEGVNTVPVDLWAKIVVPAAKPDYFPQLVSEYAFEIADVSGFDAGFVAMASMVALAGAIHDGIQIQCKRNDPTFLQDPRLWLALIGSPSAKKSPVIRKVFSALGSIEEELRDQHAKAMKEYKRKLVTWKSDCKKAESGNDPAMPYEPEKPVLTRLVVDDTTTERLQTVLEFNPRGVIQVRDELSGWFASMGAYGDRGSAGKDEAHFLQLYDGGSRFFDRQGRDDVVVKNWGASVVGGIQPDVIRKIADKLPNNGLLQRFVPIMGQARTATDRPIDMGVLDRFNGLIASLYVLSPRHAESLLTMPVQMSVEADRIRKHVFDELNGLVTSVEGAKPRLASHLGKWEGLFCRLVLVVHCVECVEQGVHPTKAEASPASATLVQRLMLQFMLPHLMCFYESILEEGAGATTAAADMMDDVQKVAEHIISKGWVSFTDREITHAVKRWRYRSIKEKSERYAALEAMDWIIPDGPPDRRGLCARYWVNPAAKTMFAQRAHQVRESMKIVADILRGSRQAV